MKKRVLKCWLMGLMCWGFAQSASAQQHPLYAQYNSNGMVVNPSYPSMDTSASITAVARNQWVGMEGAPKTMTMSFYTPIKSTRTSIGFMAFQDKITVYSQTGFHVNISQKVKVGENVYLALGLQGGAQQFKENNTQLNAGDDYVFANDKRYWKTDVGFGFMLYGENFMVGFSAPSFHNFDLGTTENKVEFKRHLYFQGAYIFTLNSDIKLKPGVLMRQAPGAGVNFDVNASLLMKNIVWVGLTWRTEKTTSAFLQVQATKNILFGYSYDFAGNQYLKTYQQGSHEVMLNYRFSWSKDKPVTMRYF
ncbi:type IX secretion system PorP/SprF family membrane protein [Chitinophaga skermanii]|uniref:Type IX secretion system PorP/SprF family membrane protein n=1 Tax=Chitinophaga skermanii TaxID=331697 RepID=A0A327QMT6_9BACT|nr:type IX secretion system membrane protein PorP/SprF [Chitinophaga skermanii]RAJ05004.1 type IX secretion system PorP/SprF family membrane protein [Chitinophaga skermanii]